ncbi:MAG: hypothetical protein WBG57_06970, partial [Ornithinimicrobium sp.]
MAEGERRSRQSAGAERAEAADVLISGGPIYTMNSERPAAEAVAIRGGRILAVGSWDELDGLAGTRTERVDLEGRTLLPGFIDPHMHTN